MISQISTPFIYVGGSVDKLAVPLRAKAIYERAKSQDKTLKIYEGLSHEVFNEPERAQVLQDVSDWLDAHI